MNEAFIIFESIQFFDVKKKRFVEKFIDFELLPDINSVQLYVSLMCEVFLFHSVLKFFKRQFVKHLEQKNMKIF